MTLRTRLTWDGERADDREIATVDLHMQDAELRISVRAAYHADPEPESAPGPTWELWQHEVVEVFIASAAEISPVQYTELELGPHGHHLLLRLSGLRNPVERELPVRFLREITVDPASGMAVWTGSARIGEHLLPPGPPSSWRINVTACHGPANARRYLTAARLSAPQPDFHRPDEWLPSRL